MAENKIEIMDFRKSYWNYYLELERQFKEIERYVALDRGNNQTFSVEFLKLIEAVCSEIDTVAKAISEHYDNNFSKIKNPGIRHWGYILSQNMPDLSTATVELLDSDIEIVPWNNFGYMQYKNKKGQLCYKLADQCDTPSWWKDYNSIKHQRTARDDNGVINFSKANLRNVILSFSALFSLEAVFMERIQPSYFSLHYKLIKSNSFMLQRVLDLSN